METTKTRQMVPRSLLPMALCLCLSIRVVSGLASNLVRKKRVVGRVSAGPIEISSLGCGTWSWGNKLLWDYDPSQDEEIYRAYRAVRTAGVTIFDTADSYGTLELNGRAEILLGRFERRYQEEISSGKSQSTMFDLGNFLGNSDAAAKSNRQQVATKFAPYPWRITRESLVQAARESLKRLEQDSECGSEFLSNMMYRTFMLTLDFLCNRMLELSVAQLHWSTANYQPFQEGKCLLDVFVVKQRVILTSFIPSADFAL
jgi:pyridoxine 4-dehydrogenase